MTPLEQTHQILERQCCADVACECQFSVANGRGATHCPSCSTQPNLALRVAILRNGQFHVWCKLGCALADVLQALASPTVTRRTHGRRVSPRDQDGLRRCAGCGERFLPGRRDQRACSTRCRQRTHRQATVGRPA